jgi:hypothetical protein
MTTTQETINGHLYAVTRDGNGIIVSQIGAESWSRVNSPVLSKFQFRSLFTLVEKLAMDNYSTNPALTALQQQMLNTLHIDFIVAENMDLTDPATIAGVQFLESAGIIASGRAAQVLANQAPPSA